MKTPILETERLILRPFMKSDTECVFEGWEKDPEVAKYMIWSSHDDIEKTKEWIEFELNQISKDDWYRFAIVIRDTAQLIGTCLIYYEDEIKCWEVSYNLSRKYWNNGYITEAMKEILNFANNKLMITKVVGRCAIENKGSNMVLKKLGFQYEKATSLKCNDGKVTREGEQFILRFVY